MAKTITIDPDYSNRTGYDPTFLGKKVALPRISKTWLVSSGGNDPKLFPVLPYFHYTVVFHQARRMAMYTAVNIDGLAMDALKATMPGRVEIGSDKWFTDTRIDKLAQIPEKWYAANPFDLGHIVRRQDSAWGDTVEFAVKGSNDTFHLTNASPQHEKFNRNAERWKGLEDYILKNSNKSKKRVTVFSGAVFRPEDKSFNDVQIPYFFWKVVVYINDADGLSATAYLINQDDLIRDLPDLKFDFGPFKTYQTEIQKIEALTGLLFGLKKYDVLLKQSSKRFKNNQVVPAIMIDDYDQMVLG